MKNIINTKELKKKRGKMKSLSLSMLLLFSTILINVSIASAVNDFDQYKPYLHNPSVGNVPKLETFGEYKTDLYPGAGTYTYNIVVPRGILGLQPSISLFYNSQSVLQRPGVLGAGWSLSENSISRNINYSVNDTTDDYFILSFNNNRLKVFYNGSSWNTEINPRQYRVQNLSNGAKMYWLITTTDGTEYRFGFNNDSKMDSNTGRNYAVKWNLDLIEDVNENKIFYNYKQNPFAEDKGAIYLSNITYNNDEKKLILFSYETRARPDRRLIYDQGNILDESRRLNEISILFDGSLVRRYSLGYETLSDIQSLSSLANITYFGADNSSVLNTISFEYYNTTQGFDNTTNKWVVPGGFVFSSSSSSGQDFGVRLLDVNNDGFPDLIKAKSGETHETRLNNKQDGWNASSILVIPSGIEIADGSGVDKGVRFEDVNSDGLIDILQAKEGSTKKAYINNGTGWNDATNWTIPTNFIGSSSEGLGVELTDINGDGKVDIIRSQEPNIKEIYTNNGSGWKNVTSDWNIPDFFSTSSNKDTGLRILDINNDGLPDLIKGGIPGNAWFNNGSGWTQHSEYAPNLEFVDNSGSRPDLGVRFIELNGDGLVDIVQNFLSNVSIINQTCVDQGKSTEECITGQNITFATNAKLNNGTGWMSASGWLSPEKFTDEGLNIGRRIADVNGDGYPDIVVAYQGPPSENITHIKNATNAFLLKTVVGAYGGETEIHYTQSTLSDNGNNLGFNIWIVKNTSLNNSVGNGFEAESGYSYLYFNGKFDYLNKEFRGFGIVNETLPDSSTVSHFFHQDNALKGREFKTSIYGSQGNHIRDNLNSYSISGDNMIYLNETSSQIYDGEATPFVTNVTFEYDLYGNIQKVNNLGNVDISGDEKFETFNYFYNTTNFVVNKPSNYTLFASDDSTIVNQINYFYDGQTGGVNIGRLTKVKNINNLGGNPETLYAYDSLGNVITLTNPRGYNTTYGYESTGSFKTNETNALGHIVQYNYNLGTGNLLSEVRDGLNKTFEYDIFGRLTKEIISPDNFGSPTTIYTYNLDGTAPESIKVEKKNNDSDYSEDIFIYDGFGKVIQTRNLFIPTTTQIVNNYFYDSSYRIIRIQNPYFESYSSDLTSPASGLTTNYTYDSLGRVTNITKQDGSTIGVIFDQDLVTQFDENGNRIDYNLDAYNRITNVQEYNGTDVYDTTYSYRVDNVLTNITDAKNNNFIFGYDSLGRRISLDDPNMNEWTYNYDLNGNLINQTDGRNITTFLTYDALNRLTFKKAGSSNITFVYDKQYNGTLSNITLNAQYSKPIYYRYTYDDRLRVSKEEVSIHTKQNLPGGREWFNTSTDYDSQDKILSLYLPADTIEYNYNSIGKLNSINGFLDSINYNAFSSMTNKTYNNNLVTNIDYNELNRISEIQTDSIQDLIYNYDNVGNVLSINDTENLKSYSMGYDSLNRLIRTQIDDFSDNSNQTFDYNYNSIANLLFNIHNEKNILNPSSNERIITVLNFTYGNLAHTPISEIITRPTQINVTVCGVLKFSDTTYILQGDISTNGTCFTVEANNITLDGNGHTIAGDDSQNTIGIEAIDVKNFVVKNVTVGNFDTGIYFDSDILNAQISIFDVSSTSNVGDGIWIYDGSGKHILYNINSSYNALNGIYFWGTTAVRNANLTNIMASDNLGDGIELAPYSAFSDFVLTNIITNGNTGDGVDIYPAYETKIKNLISKGNSPGDGLEISEGSDSEITDSNISSLKIDTLSTGMIFLNVSYSVENVSADSNLVRKWYYRAYVNDTSENNISNANVTAFNSTGNYQFNLTTASTGYTNITEIIDYINNGGTRTYYSLYTIYANNITFSENHTYNVTLKQTNLKDVFTLGTSITLPNDTSKYYIKDSSGNPVAWLGNFGNIVLKGNCFFNISCNSPGDNSFILRNSTNNNVAFINSTGDLCIIKGDCSDESISCNQTRDAFIMRNSSNSNMSYIDFDGDLCLTGKLYESSNL